MSTRVALRRQDGAHAISRHAAGYRRGARFRRGAPSRAAVLLAVGLARLLASLPPRRIRAVLTLVRTHAAPATAAQTAAARAAVVTAGLGQPGEGCLPRSIATALVCRFGGTWPLWCVGVHATPFAAHAWVAVDGEPIGEDFEPYYFQPILMVGPGAIR